MRLETPLALLLLLLLPLLFRSTQRLLLKRKQSKAMLMAAPVSPSTVPATLRAKMRDPLLSFLKIGIALCLIIALARPQSGTQFTETQKSGRDILLVLDTSGSMEALDFILKGKRVERLVALQSVVDTFIEGRAGDRMGLIVFGDEAFTQCPLTRDHRVLQNFVSALEIGIAGKGTAIGKALAVALRRMRDIEAESKVIVLVTDGKNNPGTLNPIDVAKLAKELDIKIHTIGIGGEGAAPFRTQTVFGSQLVSRKLEFDEKTLHQIAKITEGQYFHAKNIEQLKSVYDEIDKLEERKDLALEYIEYNEHFFPFALFGFLMFLLSETLTRTVFMKIP